MELFDNIIKKIEKGQYNSILVYPFITTNANRFETKKLNKDMFEKLREKIKKLTKNKSITWQQNEFYYKNLLKIEKIFNNGTQEISYLTKSSNDFMFENNNLVIFSNFENISEIQFPPLAIYEKTIKKNFEKYNFENIDIIFISQDNETTIYLDLSKIKINDKIKFKNLLENFN